MITVKSTEIQKTFGKWLDRSHEGPIAITKYDRPSAFLVSAALFEDLMAHYRKAVPAGDLSDRELSLLKSARIDTVNPFNLDDLPDVVTAPGE